eukprot:UN24590
MKCFNNENELGEGIGITKGTCETPCEIIANDENVILDVRGEDNWNESHLHCAHSIPSDKINAENIFELTQGDKAKRIAVYCQEGLRGNDAQEFLENQLGYTNVVRLGQYDNISMCPCSGDMINSNLGTTCVNTFVTFSTCTDYSMYEENSNNNFNLNLDGGCYEAPSEMSYQGFYQYREDTFYLCEKDQCDANDCSSYYSPIPTQGQRCISLKASNEEFIFGFYQWSLQW